MKQKWNFQKGVGVQTKKPCVCVCVGGGGGGVSMYIFWNNTILSYLTYGYLAAH